MLKKEKHQKYLLINYTMIQNEDEALAENPEFWAMIDEAATVSREES